MTEQFVAALIGAPFGLTGLVKVRPLSGEIDHLLALRSVAARQNGTERVLRIEQIIPQPPVVLMKFAGIDSPEAAKTLGGAELLVDRGQASPLRPGEFYVEDLKGLAVISGPLEGAGDEILGHITDIIEGGGGELAEIRLMDGQLKLVPFRREFFSGISPETGRVVLLNRWILE
jgi:16S rRNA processing protein RimM